MTKITPETSKGVSSAHEKPEVVPSCGEPQSELTFIDGKVHRRYTEDWRKSGNINTEKIPEYVAAIVSQQKYMVQYIEKLHDKIDELLKP